MYMDHVSQMTGSEDTTMSLVIVSCDVWLRDCDQGVFVRQSVCVQDSESSYWNNASDNKLTEH